MAGALDEDTAQTLASGRATVGSMLSAAQAHLKRVFLLFVTVMLLTIWALRAFIWDQLKRDLVYNRMDVTTEQATEIVVVTPFDVILLQVKIGIVMGILASIPLLIWYGRDGLRQRGLWPSSTIPRWKIWGFVVAIILLFFGGVTYAYFLFFPIMFDFLAANAVQSGFEPTWSIVMWTEFIFLLTLSFGIAAQLPLVMSSAARANIVSYETFRDKWRYAVVGIFVFGAMFSPPDPFTQVMWGVPLVALYFISLGVTKLAVVSKQASDQVSNRDLARVHWNKLAGVFLIGALAVYAYLLEGGLAATNDLLETVGSDYRFPVAEQIGVFGLSPTVVGILAATAVGLVVTSVVLFYFKLVELDRIARGESSLVETGQETDTGETGAAVDSEPADEPTEAGEPAEIDIGAMPTPAIQNASVEAFLDLSEERALHYAQQAVENDNPEKAKAILDRFDEAEEVRAQRAEAEAEEEDDAGFVTSTTASIVDPFTEDETDEDDIGGYYYDLAFIVESLTSKAIWLVGTFMVVMAATFLFLYQGGILRIQNVFFRNMPEAMAEEVAIVTLHPVEALIFMLKFSLLLGGLATIPILLYFAWPAIQERGLSTGNRNVILVWGGSLFVALFAGTLLGFLYIAPTLISWLARDAITSNMIIAYRINSFGWLVIYLTVGIGLLAMIPTTMFLFHFGRIISFDRMRKSWRGVVIGFFAAAGFLSPSGVFTMLIVAIPLGVTYMLGLGLLWIYTRFEYRVRRPSGEAAD